MFICDICNKSYNSKRSLTSHKNHHDPIYHEKSKHGAIESQKRASQAARDKIISETKIKYKDIKCLHCLCELSYEKAKSKNKFCNHSCAALYYNKIKPKTKVIKKRKNTKYISKKKHTCLICGNIFTNRNNVKTCSFTCKKQLLSISVSKAFEEGRHRGNEYRSRISPSYMEKTFDEWLQLHYGHNIHYTKEMPFKIYDNDKYLKTFYVDFFFHDVNIGIELDGKHHIMQKEKDDLRDSIIEEKFNIKIIRITENEYRNKSKIELIKNILDTIPKKEI